MFASTQVKGVFLSFARKIFRELSSEDEVEVVVYVYLVSGVKGITLRVL